MTEDLRLAYSALDLEPGAAPEDIRAAYLDLVKIWHPDRHAGDSDRVIRRAEQKLKDITAAYERLRGAAGPPADRNVMPMDFGGRWGYIDDRGNTVIHPEYLDARVFRDGLAAVRMVDKWGFIDATGACRVTPLYEECGDFSEGLAAVRWYGRWGYVNTTGAFVIQPKFQEAGPFLDGKAEIRLGPRLGLVTRSGEVTLHRNRIE